ncbi:MAG TPA: mucoidy inhibitor MuiA family protein, partial [Streptosporangiaceae bacterium]|nr:mucoidy inhibitor MuiA family protein [Streptosporangiaceae bacterium]
MLEAPITAVTVFRDGARVQRSGTVSMTQGTQAVVIGGLPASVDPASVRVAARGPGLTLLTVEVHHGYRTDPLRDETARLRAEAERCRDAVQALDDEDAAVQARLEFLGHLSGAAATALARAVGFGRASHDDLAQMAGHLSGDTGDALGRRRDIAARSRAARRELEAAERRLDEAEQRSGQPAAYTDVSAILEAGAAAEAEVELSYHVPGASWRPLYDLTLDGEELAVSYLAEVTQQTGEDWPAVELVLATTRRGRHQGLPELDPWYIGKAPALPPAMPRMTHRAMAFTAGSPRAAAAQADQPEAAVLMAEPSDAVGAGLVYRVQRPLAVPADGGPHKTSIGRFGL